jgi:predicted transposase YdaD
MARDRKDRSSNWFMEHYGGALLRLANLPPIVHWQAAHNVMGFPKQIPDGLLDVTFAGKTTADPLIEIETYPDGETLEQIRRDLAIVLMSRGVVPDILVLVLLPKGNLQLAPEQVLESANGLTQFRLKVQVLNLWTIPADQLLATGDVGLIPWAPLARIDGAPREFLEECVQKIEDQAPPNEKANLLAITRVMVEARYNDVELLKMLGGELMSFAKVMSEMPVFKRLIAQKERRAAAKAERSSAIKHILTLLRQRFTTVPKDLSSQLHAVDDLHKLEGLLKLVWTCDDLDEFRKAVDKR